MRMRQITIVALLALGAVLVLGGCGGGGSDRLTQEEWAAEANKICADFNARVDAAGEPSSIAELRTQLEELIPLFKAEVADIDELSPPESAEADVEKLIELGNEQIDLVEDVAAALKKNDQAEANRLLSGSDQNDDESDAIFERLGATTCTED